MSVTAAVTNHVVFSGDQESEVVVNSGELADSPCMQELVTLAVGNNTIEVPDIDDFTVHGLMIIPPTANAVKPTLKGSAGDVGISLNASQASVIQFGTPPTDIVISTATEIVGVRLVWF